VKNVLHFIDDFEEAAVRYSRAYAADGAVCGHIHSATVRKIGTVDYYNTGDWVESCTALVEDFDGTMKLVRNVARSASKPNATLEREKAL
jgi:UDP-2,3-diacylglucosamine pyrophosphatase LpxH